MAKTITKGKIGNALTSTANDHVVAVANDIYDESIDKYQSQINEEVDKSVFVEVYDPEEEIPQPEFINIEDATYAYNWKTTDTPASDGKTQGNIKDLYQKTLNQEEKFLELESEVIYDVSAHNNGAVFESLSALLSDSNLSTLIPSTVRCGGMSIRFIQGSEQSSNNKYAQYRLMSDTFNTIATNWQGVDNEPTANSDNLVKSGGIVGIYGENINDDNWLKVITDSNGTFIFGIKKNGEIEWSKGIPTPIQEYVQNILEGENGSLIDGVNKIYAFLTGYSTADTLNILLDEKVKREEGKSLIDENFSNNVFSASDNNNFYVLTDNIGHVISKIKKDGSFYIEKLESPIIDKKVDKEEEKSLVDINFANNVNFIEDTNNINVLVDNIGHLIYKIKKDGTFYIEKLESPIITHIQQQIGKDCTLVEVPITLTNNYLDNRYNEITDVHSIHALIEDINPKATYLFMVPPSLTTSFVTKPFLYSSNDLYSTSSSFSINNPQTNIAFNLHDYSCESITSESISLGTFEYGSFNGSGNDAPNAAAIRSEKIYNIPKGILKITFDDSKYYIVINTFIGAPASTKNTTINTSGEEVEHFGNFIRVSIRYKNDTPVADQALIDAADNGAVIIERVAAFTRNLTISTLTQDELNYIKVYKFIPKDSGQVLVAANDSNINDKAKADIILDGNNDTRFLQALVSSFTDINIVLCPGNYNINEKHYIKRSNQYACLSTFDAEGINPRTICLCGQYENRRMNTHLNVSDKVIAEFSDNNENAIFLIPRLFPVNKSKLDKSSTYTGTTIKHLELYGDFYTRNITGFDTVAASAARYENINVNGFKEHNTKTFPTMPVGSVGIRTGRGSNNGVANYIKNCSSFHLERGFSICGEHYIIEDCLAHHCKWGFAFHDKPVGIGVEHPNIMIGCSIEGCYQLMLLTRQGAMSQEEYDAIDHNKGRNTLICIGLSTETSWAVPIDERTNPDVEERETTLGIWEVIPGRYRGRIEGDNVTVMEGSCPKMTITSYQ